MTFHNLVTCIPNGLTLLRMVLSFALLLLFAMSWSAWLLPVFLLACLTDALDGHLARHLQVGSVLGELLDPIADKVLLLSGFFVLLLLVQDIHVAFAGLLIFTREFLVVTIRAHVHLFTAAVFSVNRWGKLKTILQFLALAVMLYDPEISAWSYRLGHLLLYLAVLMSWVSFVFYLKDWLMALNEERAS